MLKGKWRFIGITAALVIVASACGGGASSAPTTGPLATAAPGATAAPAEQELKVGISGPFSGPNALTGEEIKNASTMAFDADRLEGRPVHDRSRSTSTTSPTRPRVRRRTSRPSPARSIVAGAPRLAQLGRGRPDGGHREVQGPALLRDGRHRASSTRSSPATRPSTATGPARAGRTRPSSRIAYVVAHQGRDHGGHLDAGREEGRDLRRGNRLGPLVRRGPEGPDSRPRAGQP